MEDAAVMQRAVHLGEQARVGAGPDPWVGCVIVDGGVVVGEGAHHETGGPHAEPLALRQAGSRARGATAYVTLEPCDHHARTPPCSEALIDAGIARVVVAFRDPDPRVSGRGIRRLRDAGIEVVEGVGVAAAERSLRPYLHHRRTGRPWCVLKTASTIDGRTAAADGTSRWITGLESRRDAHRQRARSQALIVGSTTAVIDRPALTVRDSEPVPVAAPLRIVLDARGRLAAEGDLFDTDLAPTLIATTAAAPLEAVTAWKEAGAEVIELEPGPDGGVDVAAVLNLLGRRNVVQALVEGGATLHGTLIRHGLADELIVYVGAKMLGERGRPVVAGLDLATIDDARNWELVDVAALGNDVRIRYLAAGGPTRAGGEA